MKTRLFAVLTGAAISSTLVFGMCAQPVYSAGPIVTAPLSDLDIQMRTVSYEDLNLLSDVGQKALKRRVGAVVGALCGDRPRLETLIERFARRECTSESWSNARPQIAAAIEHARANEYAGRKANSVIVVASK